MPKIDVMLKMMSEKSVERAILRGDKPYQVFAGSRLIEGSITPQAQLREMLAEIVPSHLVSALRNQGAFSFQYASPYGTFDVGVVHDLGSPQITLVPALSNPHATMPLPAQNSTVAVPQPNYPQAVAPTPTYSQPSSPTVPLPPGTVPQNTVPSQQLPPQTPNYPAHPQSGTQSILPANPGPVYPSQQYPPPTPSQQYPPPTPSQQYPPPTPSQPYPPMYPPPGNQTNVYVMPQMPNQGTSPRSRVVGGLLGIFLGWLGVHRFYLGYSGTGVMMLLMTVLFSWFTCFITFYVVLLWGAIEGIVILCGGMKDAEGRELTH